MKSHQQFSPCGRVAGGEGHRFGEARILLVDVPSKPRLAVFFSGTGRTLENLLAATERADLIAEIACVVSSRRKVRGCDVAREAGIPLYVVPRRRYASVETFSSDVWKAVDPYGVDLVVLAGWLSQLVIPEYYQGRIVNIHPSLLPLFGGHGFYGHHVHEAVLASGMKVSGCTVHFVDAEYDAGPIIAQRCVPVLPGDSVDSLAARVFAEECRLYPEAIGDVLAGRARLTAGRVVTQPHRAPDR